MHRFASGFIFIMSETVPKPATLVAGYGTVSEHPKNPPVKAIAEQTLPFKARLGDCGGFF